MLAKNKTLPKLTINQILSLEKEDRQYKALELLFKTKKLEPNTFLFLIIANALICYQLSGKGEDYWEEFAKSLSKSKKRFENFKDVEAFFSDFLQSSKNNKRFVNVKLKRIKKLESLFNEFSKQKTKFFYKNMYALAEKLAEILGQKINDKTIVFAIKMFGYGARIAYGETILFPDELEIPVDSRVRFFYEFHTGKRAKDQKQVQNFVRELSKKLNIPPLHLDVYIWSLWYSNKNYK